MDRGIKRLYRSDTDHIVSGVCGGIGEYLEVDANFVRVAFVLLAIWGGAGIFLYLAALFVVPRNPIPGEKQPRRQDRGSLAGMILIAVGGLFLLGNFQLLHWIDLHLSWKILVPSLFIILGAWLLIDFQEKKRREQAYPNAGGPRPARTLYRSLLEKKILGVCGGFAEYFQTDVSIVRIIWLLLLFSSFGLAFFVYLALGILLPPEQLSPASQPGGES